VAAIESFSVSRSAGALMREWSLTRAKVSRHLIQDTIPESTCRPCCRYAVSCMQDFRLSRASMTTIWMHSSTCGLTHIYMREIMHPSCHQYVLGHTAYHRAMAGHYCYTHFHRKSLLTSHSYLIFAPAVRVSTCETDLRFATLRLATVILACTTSHQADDRLEICS